MISGTRFASVCAALAALSLPAAAFAHTGVGHTYGFAAGLMHPVGGLDHLLAMVAVGLWAAQLGGRALWLVPTSFVLLMLVGGTLGASGMQLPFIEPGIALSVLVLGLLVAGAFRINLAASALIVGLFALFHGHAHGAEMPMEASALGYSLGFALATALLHTAGIGSAAWLQRLRANALTRLTGGAIAATGLYLAVV